MIGVGPDGKQVLRGHDRWPKPPDPEPLHGHKRLRHRRCQQQGDGVRVLPGVRREGKSKEACLWGGVRLKVETITWVFVLGYGTEASEQEVCLATNQ